LKECSKSIARRLRDPNFLTRYFAGVGLDIGGRPDPLVLYSSLFPQIRSVRTWDLEDGDAQFLSGLTDHAFDFVHSSHCLEHLQDPREGLRNWFRVVRPAGFLIVTIPDEDLYEQGSFPSTFNRDHKWTFTVRKARSWCDRSMNVLDLVAELGESADPVRIELLDATYRYELPRYDQTLTPIGECGIEMVVRKRTNEEVLQGGRLPPNTVAVPREVRIHLNQYRDDLATLKSVNAGRAPFQNDGEL
jgi:SAM-dependent methyltransferase